jgi:GR25 family glycosyltransferase involved in LPS biosynthesis
MDRLRQITNLKDIYIINLKERDERKSAMQKEMKKLKLSNYEIFPAIEGTYLDEEKLGELDDEVLNKIIANVRHCHEELPSFNAVGVFHSHLEICRKVSKCNDDEICLVLEDDVKIEDNFIDIISNIWKMIPKDFDILMLGYIPVVQNENEIMRVNQFLARYIHFIGCHAYILTGRGAKKIVTNHDKIKFQYSAYVRSLIENNKLRSYFLLPPIIKPKDKIEHYTSDVQTNQSPNLKFVKFNNNLSILAQS